MVKLIEGKHLAPGKYWQILFTEEELTTKKCKYCKKSFTEEELVYMCDSCGQILHKDCFKKNDYKTTCLCNILSSTLLGEGGSCVCGRIITQNDE